VCKERDQENGKIARHCCMCSNKKGLLEVTFPITYREEFPIYRQILDGGVPEGEKINKKIIICD
jgi:hypothetical protein